MNQYVWSLRIPPCTNKAIICIIRHSGSFPKAFFFPNASVISVKIFFSISVVAAVIRRGTLMKQSSFLPTVKEPQDQLLCSSTAEVTPPSSVLLSLLSQMTWFVFFNQAFYCSSAQWILQLLTGRFIQQQGKWLSRWLHAFQVEGNNTILFPQEGNPPCWAESI